MIFDILPFWALALACFADGECSKALIVAVVGPAIIITDAMLRGIRS